MKPRVLSLSGSDFSRELDKKYQANVLLFGDAGCKKTSFGLLHCPDPVLILNFDGRHYPAMRRAQKSGRDVADVVIKLPSGINQLEIERAKKLGKDAYDKFYHNFEWGVEQGIKGNVRTIVLDTATELTTHMSTMVCGRTVTPNNDYGRAKGKINSIWREDIFNRAREGKAHLIVLSRAKAIWKDNKPTGYYEFRCPDVVNDEADWSGNIRLKRKGTGALTPNIEIMMTKAGGNLMDVGQIFDEKDWKDDGPFAYICYNQWDGSKWSDWGVED